MSNLFAALTATGGAMTVTFNTARTVLALVESEKHAPTKEKTMSDTPLNPDALRVATAAAHDAVDWQMYDVTKFDLEDSVDVATIASVSAYLAVAQPVVNSFDPRELNRRGWTCGCEPGDYDECDDCLTAAHELANFLNRPEVKP